MFSGKDILIGFSSVIPVSNVAPPITPPSPGVAPNTFAALIPVKMAKYVSIPSLMTFNTATTCLIQSPDIAPAVNKLFNIAAIPPINPAPIKAGIKGMKMLAIDFKTLFHLLCLR